MAATALIGETGLTVGLVAVTLPANGYAMRQAWIDDNTCLVGYDPAILTRDLVARIIREQISEHVVITDGVPA